MKPISFRKKLAVRDQEIERQKTLLEQQTVQIASLTEKNTKLENKLQEINVEKALLEQLLLLVETKLHKLDSQQEVPKLSSSQSLNKPLLATKRRKHKRVNFKDAAPNVNCKKNKLDESDDENWRQNLLSENYTEIIRSTLQGSKKPLNLNDLLNAIPSKNKDERWTNSMTAIIKSNRFYCSPEGYYSERPIYYLPSKKQPAHPALSGGFSTSVTSVKARTRQTVKHWNRESKKPSAKLTSHPALTDQSSAGNSTLANTSRGNNRRTLFSLNLQGMVDVLPLC